MTPKTVLLMILVLISSKKITIVLNADITEKDLKVDFILPTPSKDDVMRTYKIFLEYAVPACKKYEDRFDFCMQSMVDEFLFNNEAKIYQLIEKQNKLMEEAIEVQTFLIQTAAGLPSIYSGGANFLELSMQALKSAQEQNEKVIQHLEAWPPVAWKDHWATSEEAVTAVLPEGYNTVSMFIHKPTEDVYLSRELILRGYWDMQKTRRICDLMNLARYFSLQEGGDGTEEAFLDLGANLGWFSLVTAAQGHRIIAVEPMPKNYQKLEASAALNGLQDKVEILKIAVSDEARSNVCIDPQFEEDLPNIGNGQIQLDRAEGEDDACMEIVETVPLDWLLLHTERSPPKVWVLKMDLEGHETAAMVGAKEFMTGPGGPCYVFAEFHKSMAEQLYPEEEKDLEYFKLFDVMVKQYNYTAFSEYNDFELPHSLLSSKDHDYWSRETEYEFRRLYDPRCHFI